MSEIGERGERVGLAIPKVVQCDAWACRALTWVVQRRRAVVADGSRRPISVGVANLPLFVTRSSLTPAFPGGMVAGSTCGPTCISGGRHRQRAPSSATTDPLRNTPAQAQARKCESGSTVALAGRRPDPSLVGRLSRWQLPAAQVIASGGDRLGTGTHRAAVRTTSASDIVFMRISRAVPQSIRRRRQRCRSSLVALLSRCFASTARANRSCSRRLRLGFCQATTRSAKSAMRGCAAGTGRLQRRKMFVVFGHRHAPRVSASERVGIEGSFDATLCGAAIAAQQEFQRFGLSVAEQHSGSWPPSVFFCIVTKLRRRFSARRSAHQSRRQNNAGPHSRQILTRPGLPSFARQVYRGFDELTPHTGKSRRLFLANGKRTSRFQLDFAQRGLTHLGSLYRSRLRPQLSL